MAIELLKIIGGKPLKGSIKAGGAKNAITKLLVASLLSDKKCTFTNVPNIADVEITLELCKEIGMQATWDKKQKLLKVHTPEVKNAFIPQRYSGANRIPILMIGALLGRTDEDIIVPTVGGDDLGKRPVNFHISALQKLGGSIEYRSMKKEGAYFAQAHNGLNGAIVELSYPSVGATENTLLAAVRAKGTTVIKNAAIEPEIVDLILFLQKLGVTIAIDADRTIHVYETKKFYEVEHDVIPDRNEIASYAMAAISTKGKVFIEGAQQASLISFLNKLRKIGGGFHVEEKGITFFYEGPLQGGVHIETDVHPGFMTDWQQPFAVLLTQCQGISVIHETVYENRFGYTTTLKKMGAEMQLFSQCLGGKLCRFQGSNYSHSLVVKGPTALKASNIHVPDLRAGFAYVMAALLAEQESTISGVHYLDRGYENFVEKLSSLGASIRRIPIKEKEKKEVPLLNSATSM